LQHTRLDRRADRHRLVRVDAFVQLPAEQLLHRVLHLGHARHAADQHDLVDIVGGNARVLEGLAARLGRLLDKVVDQRLELDAGELHGHVLGARRVRRDERQVDLCLGGRGQLDLGLLGRLLEALQGELVAVQIDALVLLELVG